MMNLLTLCIMYSQTVYFAVATNHTFLWYGATQSQIANFNYFYLMNYLR